MYINEVEVGSAIEISISADNRKMEFKSTAVSGIGSPVKGLIIEPIYIDDKMVKFKASDMKIEVIAICGELSKLFMWNAVSITSTKSKDGKIYHCIVSDREGKKVNRRTNFRMPLGLRAKMMMNFKKTEYDVIIKDLSSTGYCFICSGDIDVDIRSNVVINFMDAEADVYFTLTAIVVRKAPMADSTEVMVGCRMNSENQSVSRYVIEKQMRQSKNVGIMDERSRIAEKAKKK